MSDTIHVQDWNSAIQQLKRNELWITDNKDFGDQFLKIYQRLAFIESK